MTITPETIAKLRKLLAEATPGPWESSRVDVDGDLIASPSGGVADVACYPEDTDLIVAAVNNLAALLDEVERLRAGVRDWEVRAYDWSLGVEGTDAGGDDV